MRSEHVQTYRSKDSSRIHHHPIRCCSSTPSQTILARTRSRVSPRNQVFEHSSSRYQIPLDETVRAVSRDNERNRYRGILREGWERYCLFEMSTTVRKRSSIDQVTNARSIWCSCEHTNLLLQGQLSNPLLCLL